MDLPSQPKQGSEHLKTRRDILRSGAIGLLTVPVAMAAVPIMGHAEEAAAGGPTAGGPPGPVALTNPVDLYPKPPFPK